MESPDKYETCSEIRHGKRTGPHVRLTLTEAERVSNGHFGKRLFSWPLLALSGCCNGSFKVR